VLDKHPDVAQWYEPYFVWDRHFRAAPDDRREAWEATSEVIRQIRGAFEAYRRARGVAIVVDKSPRNCLKLPFIRAVFPEAKFIFLFRDGRDTILSIHREWLRRKEILEKSKERLRWKEAFKVIKDWLKRQPLWRHRFQALLFEMGLPDEIVRRKFLHRLRWDGRVGWGPRFPGWRQKLDQVSLLEFNALQWKYCMEAVLQEFPTISECHRLVVRYEEFTEDPESTLREICRFLEVDFPEGFMQSLPVIRSGNTNKWVNAFDHEEIERLSALIDPTLEKLGYEPTARIVQTC
jgi:hypothetical protein